MKYIIYSVIIILILALESAVFANLGFNSFYPNLILLGVVVLSMAFENYDYVFFGLFGGIAFDVYYALPIGSFTIPLILVGLIISGPIRQRLFTNINTQHFFLIVIASTFFLFLWLGVYTNILNFSGWSSLSVAWSQLYKKFFISLLANLILAYPIFILVELVAQMNQKFGRNNIKLK